MYHQVNIAGLVRHLPICKLNDTMAIAAFILLGDVAFTEAIVKELIKIAPAHDVIMTAEAKSISLAHEMARILNEPRYVVARKASKVYLVNPLKVQVNSITSPYQQFLYLSQDDAEFLKGKRVLIVDDVISTGETLVALEKLVASAGGKTVGKMAVFAEGDACTRKDILVLEQLPIFTKTTHPEYFK